MKSHMKIFTSTAASAVPRAVGAHTDDRDPRLLMHRPTVLCEEVHLTAATFQFLMSSISFGISFHCISCSQSWCKKSRFPINMIIQEFGDNSSCNRCLVMLPYFCLHFCALGMKGFVFQALQACFQPQSRWRTGQVTFPRLLAANIWAQALCELRCEWELHMQPPMFFL